MTPSNVPVFPPTWSHTVPPTNPDTGTVAYVNSVSISGNGSRIVGANYFHVYDATSSKRGNASAESPDFFQVNCLTSEGQLLWFDQSPASSGGDGFYWTAISGNGKYAAASGGTTGSSSPTLLRAYEVKDFQGGPAPNILQPPQNATGRTNWLAFDNDGDWLVAGANQLFLFGRDDEHFTQSDSFLTNNEVISVAISKDGSRAACATYPNNNSSYPPIEPSVISYFINEGGNLRPQLNFTIPGQSESDSVYYPGVRWLAMTPDGKHLAASASDGYVYYFEFSSSGSLKTKWRTLLSESSEAYSVGIADTGWGSNSIRLCAVCNDGDDAGLVFLLDQEGNILRRTQTDRNPNSVSMSDDGKIITIAAGHPDGTPGIFYVFDENLRLQWYYKVDNMAWPMSVNQDGSAIAAGADTGLIYYWDSIQP